MAASSHPPAKKLLLDKDDIPDPLLFPKCYKPEPGAQYPEPVAWVDVGRQLKLFSAASISSKCYTWIQTNDAAWWVLNSFANTRDSPYKKEIFALDTGLTEVLQIDENYLKFLRKLPYYAMMASSTAVVSPHYKTRSVQKGRETSEETDPKLKVVFPPPGSNTPIKVISSQPAATSLLSKFTSKKDNTGLESTPQMSKLPDTSTPAASPNKNIPVPYIKSNTILPQIPPGQVINPEFVREEMYSRTHELWCRFDDPKSGLSHMVLALENKLSKVVQDKKSTGGASSYFGN